MVELCVLIFVHLLGIKRVPGAKRQKVEPKKEDQEHSGTVSEGYGEATLGSISRLLRTLETLEEEDLRLTRNSTFLDIGSGYGKVVFHARLFSRVSKSFGIEYLLLSSPLPLLETLNGMVLSD